MDARLILPIVHQVLNQLHQLPRGAPLLPHYGGQDAHTTRLGFARFKNDDENVIEIQGLEEGERDGGRMVELDPRNLVLQVRRVERAALRNHSWIRIRVFLLTDPESSDFQVIL